MKHVGILIAVAGVLLVSGCGKGEPTHESVAEDMMDLLAKQVDIMEGITDAASAEAAKPKLDALLEELKELTEVAKKLGDPPKELEEELEKKYEPETKKLMERLMPVMMRLMADAEIQKVLEDTMTKFSETKM